MTIIEQADKIVGITDEIGACRNYGLSPDTYRRGAYFQWMASQDEPTCAREVHKRNGPDYRIGEVPMETLAEIVVSVHAATRPKGDGLPEDLEVRDIKGSGVWAVGVLCKTQREEDALRDYLTRCLSEPVRRLLAEFEVADKKPAQEGLGLHRCELFEDGHMGCHYEEPPILWLVPKAVKR